MHYLKSILNRILSIIHLYFVKLTHPIGFKFNGISVILSSSHFSIHDEGMIKVEKNVGIRRYCEFAVSENGKIVLHQNTFYNNGCMIVAHKSITIGEGTRLGPNVLIYDHDYDYKKRDAFIEGKHISEAISIGKNCWIGAGAIILKGTVIGDNCVIGAGCVIKGYYGNNQIIIQKRPQEIREYIEG